MDEEEKEEDGTDDVRSYELAGMFEGGSPFPKCGFTGWIRM